MIPILKSFDNPAVFIFALLIFTLVIYNLVTVFNYLFMKIKKSKKLMTDALTQVYSFQRAFKMPVLQYPAFPSNERANFRLNLLKEELAEVEQAMSNKDMINLAKELADLQYVLFGAVLEFGLQGIFEKVFNEVHKSNMTKLNADGKPVLRADGKVLKSDLYKDADIAKFFLI